MALFCFFVFVLIAIQVHFQKGKYGIYSLCSKVAWHKGMAEAQVTFFVVMV